MRALLKKDKMNSWQVLWLIFRFKINNPLFTKFYFFGFSFVFVLLALSLSWAFVLTFNISVSCSPPTIWSGCDATAAHSCLTAETQSYDDEEDYYPKFYRLFLTKSVFLWGKLWKNWNCAVIFCHGRVLKGEITSPLYLSPTQAVQGDNPIVKK